MVIALIARQLLEQHARDRAEVREVRRRLDELADRDPSTAAMLWRPRKDSDLRAMQEGNSGEQQVPAGDSGTSSPPGEVPS